jgi:prolyl-tRNA editing enzyme YbaK/EbsC (Cys-tRNA(Pro) deacylase)
MIESMKFGKLDFVPSLSQPELLAKPTENLIRQQALGDEVLVAAIDDSLADTAAFCEAYDIGLDVSANCVIVEAKRADKIWYAACVILATSKADVNGAVRRHLDARKISFAPMDTATSLTGMEYGGITPLGLPADWPILIDNQVIQAGQVIIGSGLRRSKLLLNAKLFETLPNTTAIDIAKS